MRPTAVALQSADAPASEPDDLAPYDAPARLWALTEISTNAIEVFQPASLRDCSSILHGQPFAFDRGNAPGILQIQSTDADQLIVGLCMTVSADGSPGSFPWVKVNGRLRPVSSSRPFCFALPQAEVRPRAPATLEVGGSGGYSVTISDLQIFVARRALVGPAPAAAPEPDWFAAGTSCLEFNDAEPPPSGGDPIARLQDRCTRIARQGRGGLEGGGVAPVLALMYARPALAHACRRLVLKCAGDREELEAAWGGAIAAAVGAGEVHADCWEALWRDLTVLPAAVRDAVLPRVWEAQPPLAGLFPVLAAFFDAGEE